MAFNFPQSPTIDQESVQNGIRYKWTGVKWKRLDTASNPQVTEYADVGFYSGNNVVLDTARYNYHKIELAGNTAISAPSLSLYSSNTIEIKRPFYSDQAYSITAASYDNISTYTSDNNPIGIVFKPDGTKVYYMGYTNKYIYQLDLATPWLVSSYTTIKNSVSLSATTTYPYGIAFKPDGTQVFISKTDQSNVSMHVLSTPWDITSMSSSGTNLISVGTGLNTQPKSVSFKSDGTKIYVYCHGGTTGGLFEYGLPTPWSILNPTGPVIKTGLTTQDSSPSDIYFHPDGTRFYMLGGTYKTVYQYDMSTPWSVATATFSGIEKYIGYATASPRGIAFADSGTKMYITEVVSPAAIHQYSTYATPDIALNWPTDVKWESGSAPSINSGQTSLINLTNFGDGKIIGNSLSLSLGKT